MQETPEWPGGARAALTLSFDDGLAETHDETAEWLAQSGIAASYSLITGRVGATHEGISVAGWEDWRRAESLGHEIASHGVSHLPLASPLGDLGRFIRGWRVAPRRLSFLKQMTARAFSLRRRPGNEPRVPVNLPFEATASRSELASRLDHSEIESFVYPGGRYDGAARRAVAGAGYRSARGLDFGVNLRDTDRFSLCALALGPGLTTDDIEPWLDLALTTCGWLVLVFHLVSSSNPAGYPYHCSPESFRATVSQIRSLPFWIAPQGTVVRWLEDDGT